MPTIEAIVNTAIPQQVEKPIPVRTVTTKYQQRPSGLPDKPQNRDQGTINRNSPGADSPTPEESVRLSPQLSALARKEQAVRQRELAMKQKEKELESRLAEADKYSQLKTKFSSKDFSEAESLGLSYEDYTKYVLDKGAGEDPEADRFKSIEEQVQALKKSQEENAEQEYEETVAEYKTEIAKLVDTSASFPMIKKAGRTDAVLQLILDDWENDSKETSIEDAAAQVESYLGQEAKQWAALLDVEEQAPDERERSLPPARVSSRTLTNEMAASDIKPVNKSFQHMSEQERYAEARRRVLERRQKGL